MNYEKTKQPCVRVDLFFSQAVDDDFMIIFKERNVAQKYTKTVGVQGNGEKNPKLGDAIWPQLNNIMTIFCSEEEAAKIEDIVLEMRKRYPVEGIGCFTSRAEALV